MRMRETDKGTLLGAGFARTEHAPAQPTAIQPTTTVQPSEHWKPESSKFARFRTTPWPLHSSRFVLGFLLLEFC